MVDGIANTIRAPLYPAFLGIIHYITGGEPYRTATILQSILSAFTCVIIFLLTRDSWGEKIGLTAGIIAILAPDLILYNAYLLTETLFIFEVSLLVYCLYKHSDKLLGWIVTGLLLGLAALTRPTILFFLPFLFLWIYFIKKVKIYKLLLIPLITFVVITPWTVHNSIVSGSFGFVRNDGPVNLFIGNSENATGKDCYLEDDPRFNSELSETEKNSKCYREVFNFISKNPLKELRLIALKSIFFITPTGDIYGISKNYKLPNIIMYFITGLFFEFILLGAVALCFSNNIKGISIYWLYIASVFFVVLVFFFQERYRITTYPTLIPLAAAGWAFLSGREQRKRKVIIVAFIMIIQLILGLFALALRPDIIVSIRKIFA